MTIDAISYKERMFVLFYHKLKYTDNLTPITIYKNSGDHYRVW